MPSAKTQAASRPWGTIHGLVLYPPLQVGVEGWRPAS